MMGSYRVVAMAALGLIGGTGTLESQEAEAFDGFYAGAAAASQNVWGGSFVAGVDVLAQERRPVLELAGGWRKQFGWFVAGAEIQYGFLDGTLSHSEAGGSLSFHYENDRQLGYGLTAGAAVGGGWPVVLYAYAFETSRSFDVTIREGQRVFRQSDEQGFLRYGVGAEARLSGRLGLKGTIGSYRVDFGDKVTNIDVGGELDVTFGVTLQLGG
jgi:hypothetical protein